MRVTQYTWNEGAAIERIDLRKLESGNLEAYIHAPSTAGAGELADIPNHLAQKGYSSVADNINGQNLLRVSGFKSAEDLMNALNEGQFVSGEPKTETVGEKEHKSIGQHVRKHTVKLSGAFGIIGHAALGAVGVLEGDGKRVATSAFYTTATLTSAVYGAGQDGGASKVIGGMKDYLSKQGVEIPQGDSLTPEELAKKGGVIETLHNYVKQNPLEIGNTIGLMGNMMLTYSGLKGGDKIEPARTAAGLASMLGALTVILVKEKGKEGQGQFEWPGIEDVPGIAKPDLNAEQLKLQERHKSLARKAADFVQERPMRTTGLLSLGGNLAMFADAHSMRKKALQGMDDLQDRIVDSSGDERAALSASYDAEKNKANATGLLAYTTAATYLIATAFTSLSSKTKISDFNEQEMVGKLCAMSANLIMGQPQEMRDEIIEKSAFYLSKQPDIKESRQEIVDVINEKIDLLAQSPWAARVTGDRAQMSVDQSQGASI